jgi:hypothetical protein
MSDAPQVPVGLETFALSDFADELAIAPANLAVGETIWFENERVRVWWSVIPPGERVVFHTHTIDYFWICVGASRAYQRLGDGTAKYIDPHVGQVSFQAYAEGESLTHDLENVGEENLEIVTIELLERAVKDQSRE